MLTGLVIVGRCTILCLPVAWALAWTLRRQGKWVRRRAAVIIINTLRQEPITRVAFVQSYATAASK